MRTQSKNKQTAWRAGKKAQENKSDQVAIGFLFWSWLLKNEFVSFLFIFTRSSSFRTS